MVNEDRGTRVYVGNLGEKVKKEDLEGEFTKYGKLNSVWVAFNPPGFAFVEFENRDCAVKACDILNGTEVLGSKLRVEISKGRPKSSRRDNGGGRSRFGSQNGRSGGFRNGGGGGGGFGGQRRDFGGRSNSGGGGYREGGGFRQGGRSFGGSGGGNYGGNSGGRFASRGSGSRDGTGGRSFGNSGGGGGFNRNSGGGGGGGFRNRSRSPINRSRF